MQCYFKLTNMKILQHCKSESTAKLLIFIQKYWKTQEYKNTGAGKNTGKYRRRKNTGTLRPMS